MVPTQLVMESFRQANDVSALWHRPLLEQDYALINPLQVDSVLWADLPLLPLVPKASKAHADLMPRLLNLKEVSEQARLQLLDRVSAQERYNRRAPYFSALFMTSLSSDLVAARLSDRLIVRGPAKSIALLRYYDPRVFRHLRWLLDEKQMNLLLLGIDSWTWCDEDGCWQQFRPGGKAPNAGLHLSAEQWGGLQRLGLLNQCLRKISDREPERAGDDAIAKAADALLRKSYEQHGLADRDDRCLYAEQGIRFHPEIHRHPELEKRLAHAQASATSYVSACRDLDDLAMQKFAKDLRQLQGMSS